MDIGLMLISVVFAVIGQIMSSRLQSKFKHYSGVPLSSGMNGAQVAEQMLRDNNINDVQIIQVAGQLTDHYNPQNKTVNLSHDVYYGQHVAAAAVASHEVGHAIQHATSYSMLKMRSAIVPIVSLSANFQQYILMIGLALMYQSGNPYVFLAALAAYAVTTFFSLVTLPVEFDASRRAMAWLDSSGVARGVEHGGAKDALFWAAMTYVVAAVAAVVQLLYILSKFRSRQQQH